MSATATTSASVRRSLRQTFTGSPGTLRRIGMLAVLGALLVAVGGGLALTALVGGLRQAREATTHRVLVLDARTSLARADAAVTSAFLRGGLEPTARRQEYVTALAKARSDLALAARTGRGSGTDYAAIEQSLARYGELVEGARQSNRHGLAVGSNYLQMASRQLRSEIQPALAGISAADLARARSGYDTVSAAAVALMLCAAVGLLAQAAAQVRLARLTRAVFTPPAAVTALTGLGVVLAVVVLGAVAANRADDVRRGDARRTDALAEARTTAFDARSLENLTLVGRGSMPQGEAQWQTALRTARERAAQGDVQLLPALDTYAARHAEVHQADADGHWAQAVRRAIDDTPADVATGFAAFDATSAHALERASAATQTGLSSAIALASPATALVVLAGLVAAAGAGRGVSVRLAEYR